MISSNILREQDSERRDATMAWVGDVAAGEDELMRLVEEGDCIKTSTNNRDGCCQERRKCKGRSLTDRIV